ncbi:MAG TPA: helix-turn-helix domain-containing protein [Chitinophaga sp.]|uniref:GlxA family transcriptional regulator n=1 Tax=Chitinophaga sp. TaxID=1869181 RepID=UPI002BD5159F|nr:helix-turn-helix domain-containing protein [Chitinophaga sp.]HVI46403.1 helix-turn-helix domain-containing protein [Chitinophaga sp.]
MKTISVLIPEGDISINIVEGIYHIFLEANKTLVRSGRKPVFHFQLVGKRRDNFFKENFFSIHPNYLINEDFRTDLLIIPALHGDIMRGLEQNQDLLPWIVEQYERGIEVMSLCTGAFLLASTGLLSGRSCTTHWIHANEFREMFPDITLVKDEIMTYEHRIYTSGAAYSYLNLILYIVEKHCGRDIMLMVAKIFAIDVSRQRQSHFIIFQGYKQHHDDCILRAQEYIENNYQEKITVDQLAAQVALGRRNFERRFKTATSNSVVAYMQKVKIEAAKKLLEGGHKTVNEVMYEIGYNDTKAFRDTFRKITGMSPLNYRTSFSRETMAFSD